MNYRIATNPTGTNLWWTEAETIPTGHTNIRPATAEEAEVMDRILAHDAAGRMPPAALGKKVRGMLNPGKAENA